MIVTVRWQILLVALAGRANRRQLDVIAYLREENRLFNEHLGWRRLHFEDHGHRQVPGHVARD